MQNVQVLDCTLRDGGYCNQWNFGKQNIVTILEGLKKARIDVVECGFLTNKVSYCEDVSRFTSLEQIAKKLPQKDKDVMYVCMVNCGEYNVETLPQYDGTSIDGIRVAFHKKDILLAMEMCRVIKKKGYNVFVQPMVSLSYTDEEFTELIELCNELRPYAFYIVDSFGVMKRKELVHYLQLTKDSLATDVIIGFHSHNNMQLAYSNAQAMVEGCEDRPVLIDASVFGMGRGAGNLNTELFIEYLNDNHGTDYQIKPLLQIIDDVLNMFYETNYWGYSLPNYLSAKHNAHPNYAGFLMGKHTLTVHDMDEIFGMISEEKKVEYDVKYIEELYTKYLGDEINVRGVGKDIALDLQGKRVLIIAPGRSSEEEKEKIVDFCRTQEVISFSVNFEYTHWKTDYMFVSNLRRFHQMAAYDGERTIVTSNVKMEDACLVVDYKSLLNAVSVVADNAGLMLINYLISVGVEEVYLAGMDGYAHEMGENYAYSQMEFATKGQMFDVMNEGIRTVLKQYSSKVPIRFITEPRYIEV